MAVGSLIKDNCMAEAEDNIVDKLEAATRGDMKEVKTEIKEVGQTIIKKAMSSNRAVVLQTAALIITLLGLAVAAERRITTIEVKSAQEVSARVEQDKMMLEAIRMIQDQNRVTNENQIKIATIIERIERRHDIEDQRRSR